jgi:predicted ABC-type ATPase
MGRGAPAHTAMESKLPERPTLHLLAGVNGSGKTTFYRLHLASMTPGAEFVNADEIARSRWPGREDQHARDGAALAVERREELFAQRVTFVTETVFSHPSKLDLVRRARAEGYRVILYHIGLDSEELARARVATRVETGGHDVPADKLNARYARTQRLIPQAASMADLTFVYDNSGAGGTKTHRHVMTMAGGEIRRCARDVPGWVEAAYHEALATHHSRGG